MKEIITYLEKIVKKSNNKINRKFNFSKFDTTNIFLINKILDKQYNLWFESDKHHLDKFYESTIYAFSVYYFEMNYCEGKKIKPEIGDKYRNIKRKSTFEVIKLYEDNRIKLKGISKGRDKELCHTFEIKDLLNKFTKLSSNVAKNNRTPIKLMLNFIKKTLNVYEQIPSFPHKFAIVTQNNEFENSFKILKKKTFPYTYIADSGEESKNIQLADSMFFVASNYYTIQEYVFDNNIKLESIIFIGNKYNNQIQSDIDRNYFKQALFIGEQKPDVDCLKWYWTLPEYQYFNDLQEGKIEYIGVTNDTLNEQINKFINYVRQLEEDKLISLQKRILPYISYIYSLVILTETSRLKNRVDELLYSFQKKSKQVLEEVFNSIGLNCEKHYAYLCNNYQSILEQFYFKNNAKTQALKRLKETDYLLAPEQQTLQVWQLEIKKLNWQKVKIISFNGLKNICKQKTITVLSIKDYDFYCRLRNSNCNIQWLLYEQEQQCLIFHYFKTA